MKSIFLLLRGIIHRILLVKSCRHSVQIDIHDYIHDNTILAISWCERGLTRCCLSIEKTLNRMVYLFFPFCRIFCFTIHFQTEICRFITLSIFISKRKDIRSNENSTTFEQLLYDYYFIRYFTYAFWSLNIFDRVWFFFWSSKYIERLVSKFIRFTNTWIISVSWK